MFENKQTSNDSHASPAPHKEGWASDFASTVWADVKGASRVATDVAKGAGNELIHHPGHVVEAAAIGLAATAATTALGIGVVGMATIAGVAAVGYGAYKAEEIVRHEGVGALPGHIKNAVHKGAIFAENIGHEIEGEGKAIKTRFNGTGTAAEQKEAQAKVEKIGATGLDIGAGVAGGIVGSGIGKGLAVMVDKAVTTKIAVAIEGSEAGNTIGRGAIKAAAAAEALKAAEPISVAKSFAQGSLSHIKAVTPFDRLMMPGPSPKVEAAIIGTAAATADLATDSNESTKHHSKNYSAEISKAAIKNTKAEDWQAAHHGGLSQLAHSELEHHLTEALSQTEKNNSNAPENPNFVVVKDPNGYFVVDFKSGELEGATAHWKPGENAVMYTSPDKQNLALFDRYPAKGQISKTLKPQPAADDIQ